MRCTKNMMIRQYLYRFNLILCEMEEKMTNVTMTNNITINFIRTMIPHHKAAICMCENLLFYTHYKPLIEMCNNTIKTQTNEIERMNEILNTTSGYTNLEKNVRCYISQYFDIVNQMIEKMKNSPRCMNINLDFINEMTIHHKGAIAMSENLLQYCIDPRLKEIAETIIKEQNIGINKLEELKEHLCM